MNRTLRVLAEVTTVDSALTSARGFVGNLGVNQGNDPEAEFDRLKASRRRAARLRKLAQEWTFIAIPGVRQGGGIPTNRC